MASNVLDALKAKNTHVVGSLNSLKVKTLAHGAKVTGAAVDNFTLVELAGFNEDGERLCKQLADKTHVAYLIAAPEQRYLNEELAAFYNAVGDEARLVVLEPGYTRFETSAFELNTDGTTNGGTTITDVVKGQVAHFNTATKKFMISDSASPATDYATAKNKFEVVGDLDDTAGNFNVDVIRFMCIE